MEKIPLILMGEKDTNCIILKCGKTSKIAHDEIKNATLNHIVEDLNIKNEDEEPKFGGGSEFGADHRQLLWKKRKHYYDEKHGIQKSTILSIDYGDKKKKYVCREEEGALENVGYYVMRRNQSFLSLTPVDDWLGLTPSINYKTLNEEEAELEFGKRDHFDSIYAQVIKKKIGVDDEQSNSTAPSSIPEERKIMKKSTNNNENDDDEEDFNPDSQELDYMSDKEETIEPSKALEGTEVKKVNEDAMNVKDLETLTGSEESDDELTEQGKELKKMLKKYDSSEDEENEREDDEENLSGSSSDDDEDIDQLEAKYSSSKIFSIKPSTTPFQNGGDKTSADASKNQVNHPLRISESTPILSKSINTLEKFVEENIKKYLSQQPMCTGSLLHKLILHAPQGFTKEQIVCAVASILKRIGVCRRVYNGKTYLDLNKK